MPTIHGDLKPPRWRESRGLWFTTLDLGTGPDGKRIRVPISDRTKAGCIAKRREKIREIEDGAWSPGQKPTVRTWMPYWLDQIAAPRVRPKTLDNYRSTVRRHIIPHLGARHLDQLTPSDIRTMHQRMERDVKPATVLLAHTVLSRALKDAVREGVIRDNPCDRMDRPQGRSEPRGAFSRAEVTAILTVARGDGPGPYSRWLCALTFGARQAELLGLEWDRVDLAAGDMDLSWQVQEIRWRHGHGCTCPTGRAAKGCKHREPAVSQAIEKRPCYLGRWFTRPKTSAGVRRLPIPPHVGEALDAWRAAAPRNALGLVWADPAGHPLRASEDRAAWKDLCLRAGVRPLTLHSARHTMVSLMLDAGVDPEVIRQVAGHSTILSTRGYMHVPVDRARDALSILTP